MIGFIEGLIIVVVVAAIAGLVSRIISNLGDRIRRHLAP